MSGSLYRRALLPTHGGFQRLILHLRFLSGTLNKGASKRRTPPGPLWECQAAGSIPAASTSYRLTVESSVTSSGRGRLYRRADELRTPLGAQ
jgi:hypothetical protein